MIRNQNFAMFDHLNVLLIVYFRSKRQNTSKTQINNACGDIIKIMSYNTLKLVEVQFVKFVFLKSTPFNVR